MIYTIVLTLAIAAVGVGVYEAIVDTILNDIRNSHAKKRVK